MIINVDSSWKPFFDEERKKEYFIELEKTIKNEYDTKNVFPNEENIFMCFKLLPLEKVKVVLVGQDPYHEKGQAMGLSFSVPEGVRIPPSLRNIYKELHNEFLMEMPKSGDLSLLAKEGVLLLNRTLTVVESKPMSHKKIGWDTFTKNVISYLSQLNNHISFILLGSSAQELDFIIDSNNNQILKGVHPSPLSASRGFFGSNIFKKSNEYLEINNRGIINYNILNEQR